MDIHFHSIPASLPPQERIVLLRESIIRSGIYRTKFIKEFLLLEVIVLAIASISMLAVMLLIESQPAAAHVLCFAVFTVLVMALAFSPTRAALRHAVRAGKLTELAICMNDVALPVQEDDVLLWQARAMTAGADELAHSLFNSASWKKECT